MLIVLGTSPDRGDWIAEASASIGREHIIVANYGYELNKIRWVMDNTRAERFLFLQDSWVIKSDKFWELLAEHDGSVSINRDPYFYGCYAGVYERWVIELIGIPNVRDKGHAVLLELAWHQQYVKVSKEPPVLFPELSDANATRQIRKHGRDNLVLENDLIVKYKGTWRHDQIAG